MTTSMSPDQIRSGASGAAWAALVDPDWYFGSQVGAPTGAAGGDRRLDALRHYQEVGAAEGLDPGPFFDTSYYRDQAGATVAEMPDPLLHFVSDGCRAGLRHHPLVHIRADLAAPDLGLQFRRAVQEARLDYSPLFDFAHFAASLTPSAAHERVPVSDADLIEHYLRGGWAAEGEPHILFDSDFYRAQVRGLAPKSTPLQHFLTVGEGLGLKPHPLFDPVRTRRQIRRRQIETGKAEDVMAAYAALSPDTTVSTHVLFDAEHYLAQIPQNRRRTAPALIDFLTVGWREGLDPHPLFSTHHYLDVVGPSRLGRRDPLSHYLVSPDRRDPHYLFLEDFYRRGAGLDDPALAGLDHYVNEGARMRLQPHPLFQPHHYAAQCERSGFTHVPNIPDLLIHYLQHGKKVPLSPIPLFDAEYYAETADLDPVTVDLFKHYLAGGGFKTYSPHPAIELDHYAAQCPTFRSDADPVLWHLLDQPHGARPTPHHAFDPEHYLAANADLRDQNICPVLHFLEHGIHQGRAPNAAFSPEYVRRKLKDRTFAGRSVVYEYFRSWKPRLRFVFVSHEASMTGAPGIIARLTTELSRLADVECLTILDRPGDREPQFRASSHVHVLSKSATEIGFEHPHHDHEIVRVLRVFATRRPDVAFVNSVESRHVGFALNRLDVPIIWLIHELATFYHPDVLPRLYAAAEIVTMPSRFVQDLTRTQIPEPPRKIKVYKQGLLIDDFGTIDRDAARAKIVDELEFPAHALVVLGCGTLDLRKGIDYFTGVAMTYLEKYDDPDQPAYFIWVGDGPRWINTPNYFVEDEIDRANLSDRIRFVGPRKNVEPYFVGADVFLLTSRGDPFPCVVHEAMASRLPVIGFTNAGGAPELYEPAGGRSVRLGDVDAMARELALLAGDCAERQRIGEASRQEIITNWRFQD